VIIIDIISLNERYIHDMVAIWNKSFEKQYHVTEKMIQQKVFNDKDTFFEGSFLLIYESQLVGFIVSKVNRGELQEYDNSAWISTLIVDSRYQNMGFGKQLYKKTEENLCKVGIKKIILGGELDNFFSGIPQPVEQSINFFAKRGFILNNDEHYDLSADISKINLEKLDINMNRSNVFSTKEMTVEDTDKLNIFFDETFPGRWKLETINYIESGGDLRNVLLLWHQEKIVGFCKIFISQGISDLDFERGKNWGSLGPIGISQGVRGKGVGNRILFDSLKALQSRGANNVIIDWTILKDFYGQFCFIPRRTYRGAYKLIIQSN
jgi:predicted N-acetyltransferase YhbS